jgi:hypothetical protein
MIAKYLDKNNLHHAYLIEGEREPIILEIAQFLKTLDISTVGNPDFIQISIDNFKIDEAFDLRRMSADKGFTSKKKIFVICVNNFSQDAQNVLLKMFEDPILDTHFFLVVPDVNIILKTLYSRLYFISAREGLLDEKKDAEKFLSISPSERINFLKEFLVDEEEVDENGNELIALDSARSRSIKFLNAVESVLLSKSMLDTGNFEHIFNAREFLRMPGSSTKILMESIALVLPENRDIQSS